MLINYDTTSLRMNIATINILISNCYFILINFRLNFIKYTYVLLLLLYLCIEKDVLRR